MRTTLAIDDDLLAAAKALALRERRTLGEVVSDLLRRSLRPASPVFEIRDGLPVLPKRGLPQAVTLELVNALRDEAP